MRTRESATLATGNPGSKGIVRVLCALICGASIAMAASASETSANLFDLSIEELGNVVVTGTRIRGSSIPATMIVITRDEFGDSGFSTLEELFESLPQNFDEVTPDGRFANEGGSLLRGLNNSRVTAVDLRGLGAQSTLTLVNGKRRAGSIDGRVVDVSAIPLSIIERVEVVTGGSSAIYGADAVAGVVNLVTRRNFKGAESQVYYGMAEDGGERLQLSQIAGVAATRGRFVAAYDYARDWPLDLGDAGLLSLTPNPVIGLTQLSLNAQADTRRHSAYLSGQFEVTDSVEIYADGFYTDKTFEDFALRFFEGATQNSFTDIVNPSEHLSLSAGARTAFANDWTLDVAGGFSTAENSHRSSVFIDLGFTSFSSATRQDAKSTLPSLSAVIDGPLPTIAGIAPRAAAGVEWRKEEFDVEFNGVAQSGLDRSLRSAFAELSLPLVADGRPGPGNVELSFAGRYDNYSDFGGTFNPQVGVVWTPAEALILRGAFSKAFRAPALVELQSSVDAFLELVPDPTEGGAAVPVLFVQGENTDLRAEEAESFGIGIDYKPAFARWAEVSLSYFHIDYEGRIEQPSINADRELVLARAERFPGLIRRNPGPAEAAAFLEGDADGFIENDTGVPFDPATQDILEVFPNLVLFDNRTGNIAVESLRGLDLSVDGSFETELGMLELAINLTHSLEHDRKVTETSPAFSLLDEVGKPADTRLRAKGGWTRGPYAAFVYLNHVAGYTNPFSTPRSEIGSWTTVDLSLRFDGSQFADAGFVNGLEMTLSVRNLLDDEPPRFADSLLGVLYDTTNASPFGRYVSLRLTRRW